MNKKEVNEISKLYSVDRCSVTRIAGCYVDGEKNICSQFANSFLTLPEEVMHKYFTIFKKALSGKIGKNLLNFQFPLDAEAEGGFQNSLLKLRDSKLKDESVLQAFFEKIIDTYEYVGNYLILLIHNVYDIPGKGSDNLKQDDASEEIYEYITCAICPVDLSKPGLTYDKAEDVFTNREQDRVVGAPDVSFMFPAFNDRASDIHSVLYYEKKADIQHEEIISEVLGCKQALTATQQKDAFNLLLENCGCTVKEVIEIHEKLNEMIEENKETSSESLTIDKKEIESLLRGFISETAMSRFDDAYNGCVCENAEFLAENVAATKNLEIKNPDVLIKVSPDRGHLVREKIVDGVKCIVVEMDGDIEINGVKVAETKWEP